MPSMNSYYAYMPIYIQHSAVAKQYIQYSTRNRLLLTLPMVMPA